MAFELKEKILAHHGPMIYEAKVSIYCSCLVGISVHSSHICAWQINKKEQRDDGKGEKVWQYHLHYQGWSSKWDEWVDGTRILTYNEENLATQKEHNAKKKASASETKNKLKTKLAKAKTDAKGKKRKLDNTKDLVSKAFVLPLRSLISR
jgi:mortality factor 4-like protein 1